MTDVSKENVSAPTAPKVEAPKAPPKQNPVFRMMGLPNFRFRLPSRNWMIFLTITGSFTGAVIYDRRQKKAVQKKWCDLVAHVSQQTLSVDRMPRKITVYLSAPPGDGIGTSRKFFKDYIKPVLVAAAMDYDVIEGRKEGDLRHGTAEAIRRHRRKQGEQSLVPEEEDVTAAIEVIREKLHVRPEPGLRGDLVLGRHTWKEYIRGIHEGWLGPLDEPEPVSESIPPVSSDNEPSSLSESLAESDPKPDEKAAEEKKQEEQKKKEEEKKEEEKKKKPHAPPAYISITEYPLAPLSPHIPSTLEPSQPLHQQHILGFLKTPIRIYNFLNRRKLADELGRDTAAIVLAAHRPYQHDESFVSTGDIDDSVPVATKTPESDSEVVQTRSHYEQQSTLGEDERYWHKSVRKPKPEGDKSERIWLNDIVIDPRIGERMRKFELDSEEAQRADRIGVGLEKTKAREIEDLTQAKVVLGSVDSE